MLPEVTFIPDLKTIRVKPGTTILDTGRKARVAIRTRCGGQASCLMCKVIVKDQSGLSPVNKQERLKLGTLVDQSFRLSCQARVFRDVRVEIPEDPLKAAIRLQLARQRGDESY